jgi:hypothetical protein
MFKSVHKFLGNLPAYFLSILFDSEDEGKQ